MKKIIITVITTIAVLLVGYFTYRVFDNRLTKHWGGTMTINVKKGHKVTEATWKDSQLWYFTEPMDDEYTPKEKEFVEYSEYGILQGKVIFKESK